MKLNYSDSLSQMRPSEIRELLKYATSPDIISFGGGMPNPETFPMGELKTIIDDLIDTSGRFVFQYGNTGGLFSLRTEIAKLLKETENITVSEEEINVTSGSQQGLYEVSKILCNQNDTVITELPTYIGAVSAFSANKIYMDGIPMDDEGLDTEKLEDELVKLRGQGKKPKFIYVIPTFQNPTGRTMSLERRKHLIDISHDYDIPIVEDNPYGQLRYAGEHIPSVKSLDRDGSVIYLGTFSKVMTPGLRIGYTVGQSEFIGKVNLLKQALDLSTNTLSEYVAREYLARGIMKKQIPKTIALYGRKRKVMLEALEKEFPSGTTWTKPDGGMFIWAAVDERIDTTEMARDAINHGVMYVSGGSFYPYREKKNEMRLNFTYSSDDEIREGIRRLSSVIEDKMATMELQSQEN